MKKTMFVIGLAVAAMAASNEDVNGAITGTKKNISQITSPSGLITGTGIQDSAAVNVVNRFFERFKAGAKPSELAGFFDERAELFIPGDTKNVPWIGKRIGQAAITDHFRLIQANIQPIKLEFIDRLSKGNRVVILGYLESRMKKNGKVMKSEFSIDIVVENGKIIRYHLLEDSFEVSNNAKL
jgi:ketosteroid isomerase-like protein